MHLTPDAIVLWHWRFMHINATLVCTWIVMLILVTVSALVTRHLETGEGKRSRWQNALEVTVEIMRGQVREVCGKGGDRYLPFVGTLFLYICLANVLDIAPGWHAPTGSLSTTAALAICVGVAVPVFGVVEQGFFGYFKHYFKPTPLLLPFHLLSETSRNVALAVRLFGNIMSGSIIVGILIAIAPLFAPILMQTVGLITGVIQAYIFAILATVYIAAAVHSEREQESS